MASASAFSACVKRCCHKTVIKYFGRDQICRGYSSTEYGRSVLTNNELGERFAGAHPASRPMSIGCLLFRLDTEFLNDLACGRMLGIEKPFRACRRHRVANAYIKPEGGGALLHLRGL